jgi:hypothetical protein
MYRPDGHGTPPPLPLQLASSVRTVVGKDSDWGKRATNWSDCQCRRLYLILEHCFTIDEIWGKGEFQFRKNMLVD